VVKTVTRGWYGKWPSTIGWKSKIKNEFRLDDAEASWADFHLGIAIAGTTSTWTPVTNA